MKKNNIDTKKNHQYSNNLLGLLIFNKYFEIQETSISNDKKILDYEKEDSNNNLLNFIHVSDKPFFVSQTEKINTKSKFQLFPLKLISAENSTKKTVVSLKLLKNEMILMSIFSNFEMTKADKKLSLKLLYEKALSKASKILINDKSNINIALRELLFATKTSRVYIFRNFVDKNGELCMQQIYEQCEDGVEPQIDNPILQNLSNTAINDRWYRFLSVNKIIKGDIEELEKEEQEILRAQGVESILVLPIMNKNGWFGSIGFDSVGRKRKWKNLDLRLLRLFSEMLGSYFLNQEYKKMLEIQNTQLKKLLETQNKFLSIVSHDLRNPFRQILSFSNLIDKKIKEKDIESISEFNANILSSTEKTLNLLSSLLEWSKITKGDFTYTPEKINLKTFIDLIHEEFKEALLLKNLTLINNVKDNFYLFADKTMIHIVFMNLISNSCKFSYTNGTISVEAYAEKDTAKISIKDNGIGIHKDVIENL